MREIKFRGKINKESAFIYGSLLIIGQETYIYPYNNGDLDDIDFGYGFEKVLPETVGQFTGLHDKNGKEIYEGDIVSCDDTWTEPILDDGSGPSYDYKFISNVIFKDGSFGVKGVTGSFSLMFSYDFLPFDNGDYFYGNVEIIGNIHENQELLK